MKPDSDAPDEHALAAQAKDLLALSKTDVRAAELAFAHLGYDRQLQTALVLHGDDLQDWLLLAEDCTDLVRALPPEHLHHSIRLIGEEDALSILKAASSEQLKALLDIEFYTDNRLDRKKVRRWIELLLELGGDEADEALQGVDTFAIAAFVRRYVRAALRDDNIVLALQMKQHHLITPDQLQIADDLVERFLSFVDDFAPEVYGEILERVFLDDPKAVASDMYAQRDDRLAARGFPGQERADRLLVPVDLGAYEFAWGTADAPAAASADLARTREAAPFMIQVLAWGRAQGELGEKTERAFIKETAEVANMLLLAHARDAGDPQAKKEALAAVQVLGSVGLEAVASGHVPAAVEALQRMDVEELFRLGWTLTRSVAKPAWQLTADPHMDDIDSRPPAWLPAGARDALLEAELLMDWRQVAASALPAAERHPDRPTPGPMLTWPRLRRLRAAVEATHQKYQDAFGHSPDVESADPTVADPSLRRLI
ncbi:MAG: hypothetical protein HS116_11090 [Planctomycetes bacterium]|nr:hypothetical protein [Planctomycetota bacterium]